MINLPIILIAIIGFIYYYFIYYTYNVWKNKKVAGPNPIPFFGNVKESVLRRKHIGVIYKEIYNQFPKERIIGMYRMTGPSLIIRDLDIIKQILVKDFDVFSDRGTEFDKKGLGDNLFHCDKATWQALHRHLTPLLTSGKIKNGFPLIDHHANQMVKSLQEAIFTQREQELFRYFRKYTMASIMAVSLNLHVDFFKDDHEIIEKAGDLQISYASEIDMLFPSILKKFNISLFPHLIKRFCYDVVRVHEMNHQRNGVPKIRENLMDMLLALKKEEKIVRAKQGNDKQACLDLTDHVIASQVFIFFAAGFLNNTIALSCALFRLAKDQKVQDKLIQEIDDVLEKYNGSLTYDGLKEMTYLGNVFSEVLRMDVVTSAITRAANKKYKIPGTDVIIEKGTPIIISPYAIHRDEKLYPDPDKFDPERFNPENSANRHPYAFIAFGAGPRACIGKQLGKIQFFVGIVKILAKFRVEPSEKTKFIGDYDPRIVSLTPKGGIYVNFIPRKA